MSATKAGPGWYTKSSSAGCSIMADVDKCVGWAQDFATAHEIVTLHNQNAALVAALRLAEKVIPPDAMVYSEGDHGERIYPLDVARAALKAAEGDQS